MKLPTTFTKTNVQIYETTDYDQFTIPDYQRDLSDSRKSSTKANYKEYQSFSVAIVDKDFNIIDGQGRLGACRDLKIPFVFTIIKDADVKDFIALNRVTVPLPLERYENIFSDLGMKDYQTFQKFRATYGLAITGALKLNKQAEIGGSQTARFRFGKFKFINYAESVKIATHLMDFEMKYGSICKNNTFITSLLDLYNRTGYDKNRMIKKINKWHSLYPIVSGSKAYMTEQLESLYNHYSANKI